jgi:hypothetical protein
MTNITVVDTLKSSLALLQADAPVRIELGTNGTIVQVSAADLANLIGVKLATSSTANTVVNNSAASAPTNIRIKTNTKRVRPDGYDFLRIRKEPTIASDEVGRYDKDEVFEIIDGTPISADGHQWYHTADGRGFIAGDLTVGAEPSMTASGSFRVPVMPMNIAKPNAQSWSTPFTASMRGVGASAGGWSPDGTQIDLVKRNRVEIVYICAYEPGQAVNAIPAFKQAGVKHFILRAAIHEPLSSPERFLQITVPILSEYAQVLGTQDLMIAVHNEPNLYKEGLGHAWADGAAFANWFNTVATSLRGTFPGSRIGFPALSPGGDVPGVRLAEPTFLTQAASAIQSADWVGVHYYWANADGTDINPPLAQWRQWYGNKAIIGTEVGPTDANTITTGAMRMAYSRFASLGIPAIGWVLSGAGAWNNAAWDKNGIVL